jgi:C-terminal processing protease CtpA/Prc
MGYVMAVGDDILADGSTHNGRGVQPDVVVLPKQSDLLVGKDTVFEAALAWVRQELKP